MECHGLQMDSKSAITGVTTSYKNKIINGNFDIWQRGSSFSATGYYYTADRWKVALDGNGSACTRSQQAFTVGQTDVPGNPTYFYRSDITVYAGLATDYINLYQPIESARTCAGETVTVSFYAKADLSRDICVEFIQYYGPTDGYNQWGNNKTISLTTSWQKYEFTTTIDSISGHTLDGNNYFGLLFWFSAGSNYNTRTNSLGTQTGIFDIARVQLEKGAVATEFEERDFVIEQMLCYRYFYATGIVGAGFYNTDTQFGCPIRPPTQFRTLPTVSTKSGVLTNINIEHNDTYDISALATGWVWSGISEVQPVLSLTVPTRSGYQGLSGMVVCDQNSDEFWFDAEI